MELSILNEILFGTLQPWQRLNQNEQRFSDLLQQAGRSLPLSTIELNKKLSILLQDYSEAVKHININYNASLPSYLYSINFPKPLNSISEFYLLLMQCSSLQFLEHVVYGFNSLSHPDDAYYLVNTSLGKIKYIAAGAVSELSRLNFTHSPNYEADNSISALERLNRNTHLIFYALKQHSIRLFFDLQTRFAEHVKETETEEQFYLYTLKEPFSKDSQIKPTAFYFEWKAHNLFGNPDFSLQASLELIEEIITNSEINAANIITAIENFICINIFNINDDELQIANLASLATSARYFEQVKQNILGQVNQLSYGYQRFEAINNVLDKIAFHKINEQQFLSALSKLHQWLNMQADAYKASLSNAFVIAPSAKDVNSKKSKPLPKTDKKATNDLKAQAQEFLKHFSGYNTQQQKILQEPDYNRLIEYTFYLIEHEKLPNDIKQIPTIGLSANHIRYTYYLMHKSFYGTKEIKSLWIDFLQKIFKQLSTQDWQTLKTKFSAKPTNYDHDISSMNS